ncbi:transglutaminase-like cysteine peptidase [uncultured Aliiroseovarius sp.]|uniref:transglutaminase-like cysteine peptidase n=1 Tax=uncultured Aliiroseovarius sp. TaxID=1658783 RepID=UPI002609FD0C|nr:transglutaminase-like cysteine peptidase [uncultured Aliiroseovarius sp.]
MTMISRVRTRQRTGRTTLMGVAASLLSAFVLLASVPTTASASPFLASKGRTAAPPGAQNLCRSYNWACAKSRASKAVTSAQIKLAHAINLQVNRTTRSVEDSQQYGVAERWTIPSKRGGDCEDYALAKKRALVSKGIDPQRLLIATVLDRKRNSHAVLVFRTDKGDMILDNMTNKIRSWKETRYVFLRMQDPNSPSRWVNVFLGG